MNRARLASACIWPLLPLALVAHGLIVPALGARGAALVTAGASIAGMLTSLFVAHAALRVLPPWPTVLRAGVTGLGGFVLAAAWPTAGLWLIVKGLVGSVAVVGLLFVLGEFGREDLARLRQLGWRRRER